MQRCLVVPGQFLPVNDVITQLIYKQLRLLPFEYQVCALKGDKEDSKLQELLREDPNAKKFDIHFVGNYNDVLFSIKNINLAKGLKNMYKYIDKAVSMYDGQEYLYTSSFPCYTTRVGVQLKQQHPNLVWIANFSDPINHSPYKFDKETYKSYILPQKVAFNYYCKYYVVDQDEINAFEQADWLVFICQEQRDFMIQQYLKEHTKLAKAQLEKKSIIVPLNYIPEWDHELFQEKTPNNPVFTLAHFGRVYGLRAIDEFLYGLQLFHQKHPEVSFRIEQYGEFRHKDKIKIRKLGLNSFFYFSSKVDYDICIKRMQETDAVLLFDTILPPAEIQPYLPSKLLEYSLLKKNVLAITTKMSPTFRIMKKTHAVACVYDRNDILHGLEKIILEKQSSQVDYAYTNQEAIQDLLKCLKLSKQ